MLTVIAHIFEENEQLTLYHIHMRGSTREKSPRELNKRHHLSADDDNDAMSALPLANLKLS